MKKIGVLSLFIFAILILSILNFAVIQAQELGDSGLPPNLENLQNQGENIKEGWQEQNTTYLKQEWISIIEKNKYLKPILGTLDKILTFLSPLFKYTLGVDYSMSWAFIIALIIWMALIVIIYTPTKEILELNFWLSLIASFIIASLSAHFSMKYILSLFENILLNKWFVYLFILLWIFLIFLYYLIFRNLGRGIRESKKKEAEKRREYKQEVLEKVGDIKLKGAGFKK